jgi:CRP-like cAMP-binding protein
VLPLAVLTRVVTLYHLDQHARVPVVEISLLRQLRIFRTLPRTALEGLAHALDKVGFSVGSALMREGEEGDCYYAIVEGTVEVRRNGHPVATLDRGEGLGEIALLRSVPRTATAVAASPVSAYRLDRDDFLTAVNGHVPTLESADRVVREVRARDASREEAKPVRRPRDTGPAGR